MAAHLSSTRRNKDCARQAVPAARAHLPILVSGSISFLLRHSNGPHLRQEGRWRAHNLTGGTRWGTPSVESTLARWSPAGGAHAWPNGSDEQGTWSRVLLCETGLHAGRSFRRDTKSGVGYTQQSSRVTRGQNTPGGRDLRGRFPKGPTTVAAESPWRRLARVRVADGIRFGSPGG